MWPWTLWHRAWPERWVSAKEGGISSPINAEKRFLQHRHQLELDMLAVSFLKEEKVQPLYPPVLETCCLLWLYYIKNTLSYSWRCAGCSEDIRSLDVKVLVVMNDPPQSSQSSYIKLKKSNSSGLALFPDKMITEITMLTYHYLLSCLEPTSSNMCICTYICMHIHTIHTYTHACT